VGRTSDAEERLVREAARLWHVRSYGDVGVNEICGAADVRKGSFYHYFASKRDLALAVIDAHRDELERLAIRPALAEGGTPLERLARMAEYAARAIREHAQDLGVVPGCPFGNLAVELSTLDPIVRDRLQQEFEDRVALAQGLIEEAVAEDELPEDTDAATSARAINAYWEGALAMAKTADDPLLLDRLFPLAIRLIGPSADVPIATF
jgi:TetR/AcrR family transcriptional repressor of nem operon